MTSLPDFPSEDRYRLLVGAVRDYAIYLLDANGRVSSWNPGAERFKGYGADEIIGQHFSVFYTPEDRNAGVPGRALETARREGRFEAEGWRVRKDGSRFWCSVVIDPVVDDRGELVGFAKITRDITEQKERNEQLQEARDSMHHAQRNEAIGRLTGGVAHDFNNFLTAIRFSAEFIKRYPDLPASLMRYVGIIIDTTEKAAQLTRQLLAYAKRQPLQPHAFDVRDSLASMRPLFETTVGSSVAVSYEFGPGDCTIFADPTQLESALLNLVINARDAMPSGGQLRISAQIVPDTATLGGLARLNGPQVALSVQDSGSGIEPEVLAHVFEPFFTTKGQHENSGLGLSQVQGFVRQSGGDVTVDSTVGTGTTFTLYLPAAKASGATAESPVSVELANVPVRREVLLVEDNRMVGEVVSAWLGELGQRLTWTVDAEKALKELEQRDGGFDLAILDLVLPGMNGMDLAYRIRERWPGIRIVLASGYSEAMAGPRALGFPVMQKPYSVEALMQVLTEDAHTMP
ncbi:PAS domain-containing sensor histidine kinase [Achromobacter sp. SLBN-14]|uniref:PAS domain-containing sensor histidine kinase n=1 Tax=Achromobacter sp. SLBN-14 TaxID=2768442 RepID=UPI001153C2EA|nr:PAS domain-containing sensor histidine kinase [Achromobacter sp. SLBN-14]TQJ97248.1 PAS/PAC sensor hybrid histidine kinase [Achromobacter sp. SLBN-14]